MNARYQITVMDNQTGEMLKAPMECEGFTIIAFHGDVKRSGIHDRMRCWSKGSSREELICALHSEPNLRKAARQSVWRGWLWELRHMFRPRRRRDKA